MIVRKAFAKWWLLLPLLASLAAGAATPKLMGIADAFSKRRAAAAAPFAALVLVGMRLWGQEILLYVLAVVWMVPVNTAGLSRVIPLTKGMTVWELLLYLGTAAVLLGGHVGPGHETDNGSAQRTGSSIVGIWAGLLLLSLGSLLAYRNVNSLYGYGNFRFVTIDTVLLFVLGSSLLTRRVHLSRFSVFLALGAIAVLVFQLAPGFFLSETGRLSAELVSPFGTEARALPKRVGLWVSMFMPLALC